MKLLLILLVVLTSMSVSAQKYGMLHVQLDHFPEACKIPFELYLNEELIGTTGNDGFFYPAKKLKGELVVTNPKVGSTKQEVNFSNKKDYQTIYFPTTKAFQDSMFKQIIKADPHLSELMECNVIGGAHPPQSVIDSLQDFQPAVFPGGTTALSKFVAQNIRYPEIARELGLQGKLQVIFRVDAEGMISCIKLVKGVPDCPECDLEGLRVISKLPRFIPGTINGKKEATFFTLPIHFKLG